MNNSITIAANTLPAGPQTSHEMLDLFLGQYKATTLRTYSVALRDFAGRHHGRALDILLAGDATAANRMALEWRTDLVDSGKGAGSVNTYLSALRAFVKCARLVGMITWALDVPSVKASRVRDTAGPGLDGVRAMMNTLGDDLKGRRDRAIISLLFVMSLRRSEVISLDLAHFEVGSRRLWIMGKGRTRREPVTVPLAVLDTLNHYLDARGRDAGPLFVSANRSSGGMDRLSSNGLYNMIQRAGKLAGIGEVRPHGLRHAGITAGLDMTGGDVRQVRVYSRHSDLKTLIEYDDNRQDFGGKVAGMIAAAL